MVTDARLIAHPNPIPFFYIVLLSKNMVVGIVDPHSPTETGIRAITIQKLAVASAFALFSTFVCNTSEHSGVFQDSRIRVNLNKDVPTLWRVSGPLKPSKPKQYDPNSIFFCAKSIFCLQVTIVNGLIVSHMLFLDGKYLRRSTDPSTSDYVMILV